MNERLIVALRLFACLLAVGCEGTNDPAPVEGTSGGVFILNEGAFQQGNAELSFYDPLTGMVRGNVYATANPGKTLGDVANAMAVFGGKLYIVVNNSARVDIVDAASGTSAGRIGLPGLPRAIAVVGPTKAYVTMQDSTVAVVDPQAFTHTRTITVGSFPEGVVQAGDRVFVLNSGFGWGTSISVIDIASDMVVGTIKTPDGPAYGARGGDGHIYVVCTGGMDFTDPSGDTPGALLKIDPATMQIVDSLTVHGHPGKLALDPGGTMFLLGPGPFPSTPVWKVATVPSLTVLETTLVSGAFYGIGVHPERAELYLADAGTFVTNGTVYVCSYEGAQKAVLSTGVGVAPSAFQVVDD